MYRAAVFALCLLLASCTWFKPQDRIVITSEPLGAQVFVDGTDTQKTTPVSLELGSILGGNHLVTLKKKGYRSETRTLYQYTEAYTSRWIDGAADIGLPPLPIFWTPGDFFFPFGVRSGFEPNGMHMKLYRDNEPLLGFDVLRRQTTASLVPIEKPGTKEQGQGTR